MAKTLFSEIADDLKSYRERLEARKQKLNLAKEDLKLARDPVCEMKVNIYDAAYTSAYKDKTYYFCSPVCKKAFDIDPKKYADQ